MWKDNESNIDYIDFEYIADLVNEIIMDDSLLPASIHGYLKIMEMLKIL